MFSWTSLFAVISLVSSIITIVEAFRARKIQPRRLVIVFILVFVFMLVISIAFRNIFDPSANTTSQFPSINSTSSTPQVPPAATVNNTQAAKSTPVESVVTPTPLLSTPTPAPQQPSLGTQLFPTNGGVWFNGWSGGNDWYTSGSMMMNNGQQSYSINIAPYNATNANVSDYAVDVDIQYKFTDAGALAGSDSFGILVRSSDGKTGYKFAVCGSANTLASCGTNDYETKISNDSQNIAENPYRPKANEWHHYRMEVKGNTVKVFIDGTKYLEATDTTYHLGGEVGLWSNRSQLTIHSFTVTAL